MVSPRSSLLVRLSTLLVFFCCCWTPSEARVIQKRAAFYIANDTMCIVDGDVYRNGDPVPTDDQCERCTCRPPGFSCVLRDCDTKPGCKAVRKAGECCPDYVCGCVHNSRVYEDGEVIKDLQNACYTCRCHGSSISCTFADCLFRGDCPPEYVQGECCPRYDHCPPISSTTSTTEQPPTQHPIIQQEEIHYVNLTTMHVERFTTPDTTVTVHSILPVTATTTTAAPTTTSEPWVTVEFTLSSEGKISSIKDFDLTTLSSILPVQTATYTETTRFAVPDEVTGDLKTISQTTQSPHSTQEDFEKGHEITSSGTDGGFETSVPEHGSSTDIDSQHVAGVTHHTTLSSERTEESHTTEITTGVTKEQTVTVSEGGFESEGSSTTPGKVAETTEVFDSETSQAPFQLSDEPSTESHEGDSTTISSTDIAEFVTDSSKESSSDVHDATESAGTSSELPPTFESQDLETVESSSHISNSDDFHSTTDLSTEATETTFSHPKTESSSKVTESYTFAESTATPEAFITSVFSEESSTESFEVAGSQSTVFSHTQETTSISSDNVDSTTDVQRAEVVTSTDISEKRPDVAPSVFQMTETPDGDTTSSENYEGISDESSSNFKVSTQVNLPTVEEEHASDSGVSFEHLTTKHNVEEDLSTHESSGDSDSFTTPHDSFSTPESFNVRETTSPPPQSSDPQDLNTDESGTDEVLLSKKATPSIEESSTSDQGQYTEKISTVGYDSESHSSLDTETESIEASGASETEISAIEAVASTTFSLETTSGEDTGTSTHVPFSGTQDGQEHNVEEGAISTEKESLDSFFSTTAAPSSESDDTHEVDHSESEVSTQRPEIFSDHPSTDESTTEDVSKTDENSSTKEKLSTDVEIITDETHGYSTTPHPEIEEITTHEVDITTNTHSEINDIKHDEVAPEYQTLPSNFTEESESEDSLQTDSHNVSMSHIPGEGYDKPAADVLYPTELVAIDFPHRPVFEDDASTISEIDEELPSNSTDHDISDTNHTFEVEPASSETESLDSETHSDLDSSTAVSHHAPVEGSGVDEHDKASTHSFTSTDYVDTLSTLPHQPGSDHSSEEDSHSHTTESVDDSSEHKTTEFPGHGLDVDENLDTKSENSTFENVTTEYVQESETVSPTEDYDVSSVYDSKVNDSNKHISNINKDGSSKPSTLDEIFSESLENEDLAQNLTDETSNNTYDVDPYISENPIDQHEHEKGMDVHENPIDGDSPVIHSSSTPHTDFAQETTHMASEDEKQESHTESSVELEYTSSTEQEAHPGENTEKTTSTASSDLFKPEIENNEIDFSSEPHQTEHSSVDVEDNVLHAFGSESELGYIDNKSNPQTEGDKVAESDNESADTFDLLNAESNSELANSHTHTTTENHETTTSSEESEKVTTAEESLTTENIDENQQTSDLEETKHNPEETFNNHAKLEASEQTPVATEDGKSSQEESHSTDAEFADSETEIPHVETLVPDSFNTHPSVLPAETSESIETLMPESFNTQPGIIPTETFEALETLVPESFLVHHDSISTPTDESTLETLVPEGFKSQHDVPFSSISDFGGENAESNSVPELTSESGTVELEHSTSITFNHDIKTETTESDVSTEHNNFNFGNNEDEEAFDSEPESENGGVVTDVSSISTHSTTTIFNGDRPDFNHTPTIELMESKISSATAGEHSTLTAHTLTIGHESEISSATIEEHSTLTDHTTPIEHEESEISTATPEKHFTESAPVSEEGYKVSTEKILSESVPTPVRVQVLFGQQDHYSSPDETSVTPSETNLMENPTTPDELELVDEHEGSADLHENDEDHKTSVLSETIHSNALEESNHDETLEYHEQEGEEITTEIFSTGSDKTDTTKSAEDTTSTTIENNIKIVSFGNGLNSSSLNSTQINSTDASPETPSEEPSTHDKYDVFGYLGNLFSELTTLTSMLSSESDISSDSNVTEGHLEASSNNLDTESNSLNRINIEVNGTQKNFSLDSYGYAYLGGGFLTGNSKYFTNHSSESSVLSTTVSYEKEGTTVTESESSTIVTRTDNTQTSDVHHDSITEVETLDSEILDLVPEEDSTIATDHHLFFIPPNSSPSVEEAKKEEFEEGSENPGEGPEKGGDWFEPTLAASYASSTIETTTENVLEKEGAPLSSFEKGDGPEKGGELFEPTLPSVLPSGTMNKRNDSELDNLDSDVSTSDTVPTESTVKLEAGEAAEEANSEASGFHPIPESNDDFHYQDSEIEHYKPEHHENVEEPQALNNNVLHHTDNQLEDHDGEIQASPDKEPDNHAGESETQDTELDHIENESINPIYISENPNIELVHHESKPEHDDIAPESHASESEHHEEESEHHDTEQDSKNESENHTNESEHLNIGHEHHDSEDHNIETEHHEVESEDLDSESEHHDIEQDSDSETENHTSESEHHENESEHIDIKDEHHDSKEDQKSDTESQTSETEHNEIESEDSDSESEHHDNEQDSSSEPENHTSEPEHHEAESEHLDSEPEAHDIFSEPENHTSEPEHHEAESEHLDSEPEAHDSEQNYDSVSEDNEDDIQQFDNEPEHAASEQDEQDKDPGLLSNETDNHESEPRHPSSNSNHHISELEHHTEIAAEKNLLGTESRPYPILFQMSNPTTINVIATYKEPMNEDSVTNNQAEVQTVVPNNQDDVQTVTEGNASETIEDSEENISEDDNATGSIKSSIESINGEETFETESPKAVTNNQDEVQTVVTNNQDDAQTVTDVNASEIIEDSEENISDDATDSIINSIEGEETIETDSPKVIDTANGTELPSVQQESTTTKNVEVAETANPNMDSNESPEITEDKTLLDTGKELIGTVAENVGLDLQRNLHKNEDDVLDNFKEHATSESSHSEASSHAYETHENTNSNSGTTDSTKDEEKSSPDISQETTLISGHSQDHDESSNKDDSFSLLNSESSVVAENTTDNDVTGTTSIEKSLNLTTTQNLNANGDSLKIKDEESSPENNEHNVSDAVSSLNTSESTSENEDGEHASTENIPSSYLSDTSLKSSNSEIVESPEDTLHGDETVNLELEKLLSDEDENVKSADGDFTDEHISPNPSANVEEILSPDSSISSEAISESNDKPKEENETSEPDDNYRYINNHQVLHPYSLTDVISDVFKAPGYDTEVHNQFLKEQQANRRSSSFHRITKRHEPSIVKQIGEDPVGTGTVESDGYHVKDPGFFFSRGGVVDPPYKSIRVGTSDGYHVKDTTSSRGRSYQESSVPSSARITSPLIIVGGKESGKVVGSNKQRLYANGAIKAVPIPYYTSPPFQPFKATVSEDELFPGASSPTPA